MLEACHICVYFERKKNKRENYCGQKEQTLCVNLSLRFKKNILKD